MARRLAALTVALAALTAVPAFAAQPPAKPLTIDTPMREILADARTRAVIVKHMPGFAERLESEPEVMQIFGESSLDDLSKDPHTGGVITPAILEKFQAWLTEAQKPGP